MAVGESRGEVERRRVVLSEVSVRPMVGGAERSGGMGPSDGEFDYLGFRCLFGGGVRHVAETVDGRWLALIGWQSGAFKVKARDAWIGWTPEQRFPRLRLVGERHAWELARGRRCAGWTSRRRPGRRPPRRLCDFWHHRRKPPPLAA